MVVFDVSCRQSFEEVKTLWLKEVVASCDEGKPLGGEAEQTLKRRFGAFFGRLELL